MTLDWQVFLQDDGGGRTYLEWMFDAWGWTLSVAGSAWVVAIASGCLMGTLRTLPQDTRLNVWFSEIRQRVGGAVSQHPRVGITDCP